MSTIEEHWQRCRPALANHLDEQAIADFRLVFYLGAGSALTAISENAHDQEASDQVFDDICEVIGAGREQGAADEQ